MKQLDEFSEIKRTKKHNATITSDKGELVPLQTNGGHIVYVTKEGFEEIKRSETNIKKQAQIRAMNDNSFKSSRLSHKYFYIFLKYDIIFMR